MSELNDYYSTIDEELLNLNIEGENICDRISYLYKSDYPQHLTNDYIDAHNWYAILSDFHYNTILEGENYYVPSIFMVEFKREILMNLADHYKGTFCLKGNVKSKTMAMVYYCEQLTERVMLENRSNKVFKNYCW